MAEDIDKIIELPAEFIHVGFIDLLCDAIYHHRKADKAEDSYEMNRDARASIAASFLSIECCANAFLKELKLPKATLKDYDRLPSISKIETFLFINNSGNNINRGDNRVQKIVELIKIRNDFVHPKGNKINTGIGIPQDAGDNWMVPLNLEGSLYPEIRIPKCAMFWSAESSLSVLKCIFNFYDYLFETVLGEKDDKTLFLLNRVIFQNIIMPNIFNEFDIELGKASELGLKVEFILNRVALNKANAADAKKPRG